MTEKFNELFDALDEQEIKKLEELAIKQFPSCDELFIKEFKNKPELAKECIYSELEEYAQTGEIKYLLSTLRDVAAAKGWVCLANETGLSRPTLYETLNGKRQPRFETLTKILNALGFRMLFVAVDNTQTLEKQSRKRATVARAKKKEKQLQRA